MYGEGSYGKVYKCKVVSKNQGENSEGKGPLSKTKVKKGFVGDARKKRANKRLTVQKGHREEAWNMKRVIQVNKVMKIIEFSEDRLERDIDKFEKEVSIMKTVQHAVEEQGDVLPCVQVYDDGIVRSVRSVRSVFGFIVMSMFTQDLFDTVKDDNSGRYGINCSMKYGIGYPQMIIIFTDIAKHIKILHDNRYAHNDVKLENVMIIKKEGQWRAALIDFGLASTIVDQRINSLAGTTAYLPPEINNHRYSIRPLLNIKVDPHDVWAYAVMLIEVFVNPRVQLPIGHSDIPDLRRSTEQKEDCPPVVKNLILLILKYRPESRISIDDVLEILSAEESGTLQEVLDRIAERDVGLASLPPSSDTSSPAKPWWKLWGG